MARPAGRAWLQVLVPALAAVLVTLTVETSALSYNQDFAAQMVYMSAAAYCPESSLGNWTCPACATGNVQVTKIATGSTWNLLAYVAFDHDTGAIVLVFRGTQETTGSFKNWILNLSAEKEAAAYPHCDCKVEAGFYTGYMALEPLLMPAVQTLHHQHPSAPLYVTGHSLGAAMAVLSAAHIQTHEGIAVTEVYTFGLPRCGDSTFAHWFHHQLPHAVHVTHHHDIVPHLPPQWFGYQHTPTEVWYTETTGLDHKVCNGSGEDKTCADSVPLYEYSIADHLVYLDLPIGKCEQLPPLKP